MNGHDHPTTAGWPGTDRFVTVVILLSVVFMLGAGVWAVVDPASFADAVKFPANEHFVHDAGAFQVGIGLTLALALIWRDPPAVVLAGFVAGNTVHAFNHGIDLDIGGRDSDPWLLGLLSIVTGVALVLRLRQLHYVVGRVGGTSSAPLVAFAEQKTAVLTTFRRNGTPVSTPLSVAVDGDRAFFRSYEKAGKTKRLRHDSRVELTPSTTRGKPLGPPIPAEARLLKGAEARHAARLLARKHPLLHGIVVPLGHRVGRAKAGRTVHFELTPTGAGRRDEDAQRGR
jgi:PPOX class probable F420-dependent enzyme